MDRKCYDDRAIRIYDIMSCFLVDTFYNSLYLKARGRVSEGQGLNITDAYRDNVRNYVLGVTRHKLYTTVVMKLHAYYRKIEGLAVLMFPDFEDKIVSQFVPAQYYKDFTNADKDKILHSILIYAINGLAGRVLEVGMLRKIIDNHTDGGNLTELRNVTEELLMLRREEYYSQFAKKCTGSEYDMVSGEVLRRLKVAYAEEVKKRLAAESDRDRAAAIIKSLTQKAYMLERKLTESDVEQPRHDETGPKKEAEYCGGDAESSPAEGEGVGLEDGSDGGEHLGIFDDPGFG